MVLSVIRLIRGLCMTDLVYDKGAGTEHNGIFNLRLDGIPRCAFHPAAAPRDEFNASIRKSLPTILWAHAAL